MNNHSVRDSILPGALTYIYICLLTSVYLFIYSIFLGLSKKYTAKIICLKKILYGYILSNIYHKTIIN